MQIEQDAREIAEKLTSGWADVLRALSSHALTYHELEDDLRLRRSAATVKPPADEGGERIDLHSREDLVFHFYEGTSRGMKTIYTLTDLGRSVASHLQRKSPS